MPQWIDVPGDDSTWQLVEGSELAQLVELRNATTSSGVTGTGTSTLASDTATAAGTTTIVGAAASTLSGATSTASGTTTVAGSGTPSAGPATATAAGTTTIVGSGTPSATADTATASGTVGGGSVTGTGTSTLASDTANASGTTTVVGASGTTLGNDTANGTGNAGTPTPPDDGYSHSTGGRPLPRRRPQPPTPPRRTLTLPGISGWADTTLQHATCSADGDVDPLNLLAEDEELLLLV